MAKKNISQNLPLRAMAFACLLGAFTSCASKSDVTEEAPSLPVSEAALLSDSEKPDSASNDASIFSDLSAGKEKSESVAAATTVSDTTGGSGPFYQAVGGESLGRVAYTLYGNRSYRKHLLEMNSSLTGAKSLSNGQQVFFDFSEVKPQPTYLTKDLLDRYPTELSEKIKAANGPTSTVTVQAGETLQKVSERLYGTTRYWTELYLINHDKISSYDKVMPGMALVAYEHGAAPLAQKSAELNTAPRAAIPALGEQPSTKVSKPTKVDSQVAPVAQPTNIDPIPDTSEMDTTANAPSEPRSSPPSAAPVSETPKMHASPAKPDPSVLEAVAESGNANLRRIIYVALIVLIGAIAFYFTRPSRKSKIDMLDVTAGSTAPPPTRNRLGGGPNKDASRKSFGG